MEFDPGTVAVLGVLGLQALGSMYTAIFGGKGQKGITERVAVMETEIKHTRSDIKDIKQYLQLNHRGGE